MPACRVWWTEIVEEARRPGRPAAGLERHLAACSGCAAEWEAQREITGTFRRIREASGGGAEAAGKDEILARFRRQRRSMWRWRMAPALATAAALVFAFVLSGPRGIRLPADQPEIWQAAALDIRDAEDADFDNGEFASVPYTVPPAPGELVRVVHTELPRAALVRMGFVVDAAWAPNVAAEVAVGEDGLPKAVRLP